MVSLLFGHSIPDGIVYARVLLSGTSVATKYTLSFRRLPAASEPTIVPSCTPGDGRVTERYALRDHHVTGAGGAWLLLY